jgi:two-component system, NtrC family, response regulator AtoC
MRGRVLIVDDDAEMCRLLEAELRRSNFELACRTSAEEALQALGVQDFDVVVADLNLRGMNGLELCDRIVANRADVPVIVITAYGSLETAIGAIRAGAYDFINKPVEVEQLVLALDRAVRHRRLGEEVKRLRRAVADSQRCEELLGRSPAMMSVFDLIGRLADSEASVLVTGETGTGKELAARALHRRGHRKDGPFMAINCAAVPESLLESQLFGHVRGAFTDARESRPGLLVQASGGTLFLDEIGDMPLSLQPKLLRALSDRTVRPLGGNAEVPFDVRIIAATNRELEVAVEEGRFRSDLFFRINVVHIHIPPLRARSGDVLLLAQHFVDRFSAQAGKKVLGLSSTAAERLLSYSWPGNVRELQNCIERAVALTSFERIVVEDLPEKVRDYRSSHIIVAGEDPTELVPMAEVERRYILRVLDAVGGNKSQAAKILGYNRRTLYRKLEEYGSADARTKATGCLPSCTSVS